MLKIKDFNELEKLGFELYMKSCDANEDNIERIYHYGFCKNVEIRTKGNYITFCSIPNLINFLKIVDNLKVEEVSNE